MINTEVKIYSIICFVLVVLLFFGYGIFPSNKNNNTRQSSLLNEKYTKTISKIIISQQSKNLIFDKIGDNWIGKIDSTNAIEKDVTFEVVFPVASGKIDEFILALSTVRNVETVSKDTSLWSNYALDDESAISVKLINEDFSTGGTSIISELFFGNESFGGRRIFCRSSKASTVFSVNNDLYSWLSTDLKVWADLSLIPKILTDNYSFTVRQSNVNLNYLSQAKGSDVLDTKVISTPDVSLLKTLQCDVGDGSRIDLSLYYSQSGSFYIQNNTTNKKHTSYSYILEISKWTYDNLFTTE